MAADELGAPLGVSSKPSTKAAADPLAIAAAGLVVLATVLAGFVFAVDDPLGGEPMAVANIDRSNLAGDPAAPGGTPVAMAATGLGGGRSLGEEHGADAGAAGAAHGGSGPLIIRVPDAAGGGTVESVAGVETAMLETSRYGLLPRVAPDGRRPAEVYARAKPVAGDERPKIALMVTGLGINTSVTRAALSLPADVSLAFVPYGSDLERAAADARHDGHEIWLQLPMEPFGFPNNDPGPQALLTNLPADTNLDRMRWSLARFTSYVGVTSYMGSRFLSTEGALAPVMTEAARRGLLVLDDGMAAKSLVTKVAPSLGLSVVVGDATVAAAGGAAAIDAALTALEARARKAGGTVVVVPADALLVERIGIWAKDLDQRGIRLAPVSSMAKPPRPS